MNPILWSSYVGIIERFIKTSGSLSGPLFSLKNMWLLPDRTNANIIGYGGIRYWHALIGLGIDGAGTVDGPKYEII